MNVKVMMFLTVLFLLAVGLRGSSKATTEDSAKKWDCYLSSIAVAGVIVAGSVFADLKQLPLIRVGAFLYLEAVLFLQAASLFERVRTPSSLGPSIRLVRDIFLGVSGTVFVIAGIAITYYGLHQALIELIDLAAYGASLLAAVIAVAQLVIFALILIFGPEVTQQKRPYYSG